MTRHLFFGIYLCTCTHRQEVVVYKNTDSNGVGDLVSVLIEPSLRHHIESLFILSVFSIFEFGAKQSKVLLAKDVAHRTQHPPPNFQPHKTQTQTPGLVRKLKRKRKRNTVTPRAACSHTVVTRARYPHTNTIVYKKSQNVVLQILFYHHLRVIVFFVRFRLRRRRRPTTKCSQFSQSSCNEQQHH